ncbi:hypothetical protein NE686_17425 [Tissierella carlieri]|uniref:Uncharacterized protein n=1 Tax=Tissierella carlieri TaxID=689904 RepID=A0ABT1SG47_9FIRM|nr:hypothetical protein [Tissierella carlieri]MCQ4924887.1 hypothetical protein [Tissierella carlieri]
MFILFIISAVIVSILIVEGIEKIGETKGYRKLNGDTLGMFYATTLFAVILTMFLLLYII